MLSNITNILTQKKHILKSLAIIPLVSLGPLPWSAAKNLPFSVHAVLQTRTFVLIFCNSLKPLSFLSPSQPAMGLCRYLGTDVSIKLNTGYEALVIWGMQNLMVLTQIKKRPKIFRTPISMALPSHIPCSRIHWTPFGWIKKKTGIECAS